MKILLPLLLLLFLYVTPANATWTCAQGGPLCTVTTVRTCTATATSCNITVTSTHAGAVEAMCGNMAGATTNTLTAATTDGTWHLSTSIGTDSSINQSTQCEYNLSATGGVTTITCTITTSASFDCEFFEFTGTLGSNTFDTNCGSTCTVDDTVACTSCNAVALSLATSNNYILIQSAATGATVTALSQSYNIAANATTGNGMGYKINVSTAGTLPVWTNNASARLAGSGEAVYEIASGGGSTGESRRQRMERLDE